MRTNTKQDILVCKECGSTDVEIVCWANPNTGKKTNDYGTRLNDYPEDQYCNQCQEHTMFTTKKEYKTMMYNEIVFGPLVFKTLDKLAVIFWKMLPYKAKRAFYHKRCKHDVELEKLNSWFASLDYDGVAAICGPCPAGKDANDFIDDCEIWWKAQTIESKRETFNHFENLL